MKKLLFSRWTLGLLTAGALFQIPACSDVASGVTAVATVVTAGAALYIVDRIVRN